MQPADTALLIWILIAIVFAWLVSAIADNLMAWYRARGIAQCRTILDPDNPRLHPYRAGDSACLCCGRSGGEHGE